MDQAILKLIAPYGITRAEEFSNRVQLLLKHDWERAKREASLRRWLCEREPQRVAYEKFKPGHAHVYRECRRFALFAALLGVVGADLLFGVAVFGGVGIKGIWWRAVEGPVWKFVGVALLVGGGVLLYFESIGRMRNWWNASRVMAAFTAVIAVTTITYTFYSCKQWQTMQRQLELSDRPWIKLLAIERPIITFTGPSSHTKLGKVDIVFLNVIPKIQNIGRSTATHVRINICRIQARRVYGHCAFPR